MTSARPRILGLPAVCLQVRGLQARPGGLQGRGRDAGRQHEEKIQGQPFAGGQHIIQARGAPDVGDLMGVRHHRGGPQGQQGPGQFPGRQHAALQVEVAVDEAGHDITALDLQPGAVVISQSRNDAVEEGHVNFLPSAGVDVGHLSARQHQVRRGLPPGHAQPLLQSFLRHACPSSRIADLGPGPLAAPPSPGTGAGLPAGEASLV